MAQRFQINKVKVLYIEDVNVYRSVLKNKAATMFLLKKAFLVTYYIAVTVYQARLYAAEN